MLIMVAVGGITRLTDSGLSMVNWKPVSGIVPPISESDWIEEFNNYKKYCSGEKRPCKIDHFFK